VLLTVIVVSTSESQWSYRSCLSLASHSANTDVTRYDIGFEISGTTVPNNA